VTTTSQTTTFPSRESSDDVRPYLEIIEVSATRLANSPQARRAGAEYDDLYQEGMVAALLSLRRGVNPTLVIANRMKDWIRLQQRQRAGDPIPYEALLPTEVPVGEAG
jgi:DNA-directed RNA polymerase specialized sigma24 family protein